MSEVTDALIARIQKLMAMAERAGTEEEADTAMGLLQQILTKHNLSMGDTRLTKDKDEEFQHQSATFEWNASWITQVYMGVAELFFCKMWNEPNGTTDRKATLVGSPVNLYSAMYVARVVTENGKRLAKEYAQHAYKEYGMNAVSASNDFKKGYASRIRTRCEDMIREAKKGHVKDESTGTALVVGDFYERNKKELEVFTANVLKVKLVSGAGMRGAKDHDAAGAGRSAADKQSLRADGITQGKGALRLGSN